MSPQRSPVFSAGAARKVFGYVTHVLVVEDDVAIASLVTGALRRAGYRVSFVGNGQDALRVLDRDPPALVVLDLMLPGINGLQITEKIRKKQDTPILMLTALSETDDKVVGLRAGADDYLAKPFQTAELIARIEAVLRRSGPGRPRRGGAIYSFAGWKLNTLSREILNPDGVTIVLTSTEFDMLAVLCSHAGEVMSRDRLVRLTQGRRVEPYDRSVDTLISRIRQKIELTPETPAMIKTVRNGGYLFGLPVEEIPA